MKIQRVIISVSDKRGLVEFARGLVEHGVEILSTGGTARALAAAGITTRSVSDYTGAPEILDGRVKTLHPRIHGGILGTSSDAHREEMARHGIEPIDLVVCNLYPFEATVAAAGVSLAEAVENIDIGGPCMIRAAAKNHERVAVVVDPERYGAILDELREHQGALGAATRRALARTAFAHTAAYDAAIAAYLSSVPASVPADPGQDEGKPAERRALPESLPDSLPESLPEILTAQWQRVRELRYGENPHQVAAFYATGADARSPLGREGARPSVAAAKVLQGKPLSYNNILDLDAALSCVLELEAPAAVIVKHTNPCGVATDASGVAAAYERARATDPTSSFGGIVAVNRSVDAALAALLAKTFLECVIAPDYSDQALEVLRAKHNLRLMATGPFTLSPDDADWAMRTVAGGILVQSADLHTAAAREARVVSKRAPTEDELDALELAWRVVKHVKSNAIVFCRDTETAAIGAGQMSRVDAAELAVKKAQKPLQGTCVGSDAFFPFRDGIDVLARAGATAVIQPGGSIRDDEVIAAADEHGMAMVFTATRHFRH
jgi:phosphoribosylaminoimidazolecarboxamide formyltransferase / IMP cyclohydrolase